MKVRLLGVHLSKCLYKIPSPSKCQELDRRDTMSYGVGPTNHDSKPGPSAQRVTHSHPVCTGLITPYPSSSINSARWTNSSNVSPSMPFHSRRKYFHLSRSQSMSNWSDYGAISLFEADNIYFAVIYWWCIHTFITLEQKQPNFVHNLLFDFCHFHSQHLYINKREIVRYRLWSKYNDIYFF